MWGGSAGGATSSGMGAFMKTVNDQRIERDSRRGPGSFSGISAGAGSGSGRSGSVAGNLCVIIFVCMTHFFLVNVYSMQIDEEDYCVSYHFNYCSFYYYFIYIIYVMYY